MRPSLPHTWPSSLHSQSRVIRVTLCPPVLTCTHTAAPRSPPGTRTPGYRRTRRTYPRCWRRRARPHSSRTPEIMIRMSLHLSGVTPATHWPVKTSGHVTLSQGAQVSPRHVTQVRVTRRSLVSSPMMARSPVVTSQGGSGDGTGAAWAVKPNTLTTGSDPTLIFLTHGRSRSPQRRCNTTLSAPDLA